MIAAKMSEVEKAKCFLGNAKCSEFKFKLFYVFHVCIKHLFFYRQLQFDLDFVPQT